MVEPAGLLGASLAFEVVFGVFLAAMAALAVVVVAWALRRDRAGREDWRGRHRTSSPTSGPGAGRRVAGANQADPAGTRPPGNPKAAGSPRSSYQSNGSAGRRSGR